MGTRRTTLALAGLTALAAGLAAAVPPTPATAAPTARVAAATPAAHAAPAAKAPAPVQDPDRVSTSPAGWGWHTSVAPSTISSWLADTGQRITDLEVTQASPLRFSAAYVGNSGAYSRAWWWYYGLTGAQVTQKLGANNARLTDIEPYATSNGIRYAVVMVKNTGDAAKAWAWYSSATLAQIGAYASDNNMRVVDSDRFTTGGSTRFAAIFVKNTGVDALSWWHYYGITASAVSARLQDNKARLINLERNSNGTFDVVMTKGGFSGSWWYLTGRTSAQVNEFVNQVGGRIFHVDSRVVSGSRYYDVIILDNTTSENRRIRNLVADKMSGKWGFYLKQVGSYAPTTGLNQDAVFEPASMMKIVHAVTALRDVQAPGGTEIDTLVSWRVHGSNPARYPTDTGYTRPAGQTSDKDVCAYDSNGAATGITYSDELGDVLIDQMLQYSDNRATDGILNKYGFSGLNDTIALAGMTSSKVVHRIGCGTTWAANGAYHNRLTLVDAGRIYEGVQNLSLLDSTRRAQLYEYLLGGPVSTSGALGQMITAEANAAGLTASERSAFLERVVTRSKGGSYGLCPDTGACNPPTASVGTVGGTIWLPFKGRGGTVDRAYVYGRFLNIPLSCSFASVSAGTCTALKNANAGMSTISVEMFRAAVRSALATW